MIAYIFKIATREVMAKLEEQSEENFFYSIYLAIPNKEYAVRFEQREGEKNE